MKKAWCIVVLVALCASCSVQRNTALTRFFHTTKVRYNIYYNGHNAYEEGLTAIQDANQDDYTTLLPLYPVSNHQAVQAGTAKMDETIEKCRKSIRLHSIKKKPEKINERKRNDPAYKAWLKQEEFNRAMPEAWIMLAEAEFHKGEFLESIGTFHYVEEHMGFDRDIAARCQLWSVRAYAEEGWLYEAEDLLQKVPMDALKRKNETFYAAVAGDLRLRQGQYKEAIPYIKLRMDDEKRKGNRPRFAFVLAQLYEKQNQPALARAYYKKVVRMYPNWEMDFQARLRMHELDSDHASALKQLRKMVKQDKYKDRLDELYGVMGNIALNGGDTVKALGYYEDAIRESTQGGPAKGKVLVTAGDLYFNRKDYEKAQPCYTEAATILPNTHTDYRRVKRLAEVLDELVVETGTVQLQDSLQRLSRMSEEEQLRVVEQLIANLIEQERQDSIAQAQQARAEENGDLGGPRSVNTSNMLGGSGGKAAWYFYNPNLIRQGKQQFQQKWGNRKLEDNWRRRIKSNPTFATEASGGEEAEELPGLETDSLAGDSIPALPMVSDDPHSPQYYLQQIPKTEEDIAASNELIATALYNEVGIYRDKLEDMAEAEAALDELRRRFPEDERVGVVEQLHERIRYMAEHPEYGDSLRAVAHRADALYEMTYKAYRSSDYQAVKRGVTEADSLCGDSPLMPRFLFLNAVATARTDGQEAFVAALRELVTRYPSSALGAKAKDMLSLMNQGMESQTGGTVADLAAERTEQLEETLAEEDTLPQEKPQPRVLLVLRKTNVEETDAAQLNNLLYEVALFNFSQFMIKDFDLRVLSQYAEGEQAVEITGFDASAGPDWYADLLEQNAPLQAVFRQYGVRVEKY